MIPPPPYAAAREGYNRFTDEASSPAAAVGSIQPSAPDHAQLNALKLALAEGQAAGPKQVRARKAIRGLGITQIVLGVLLALFNIAVIVGSAADPYYYGIILGVDGTGIWEGVLTGIAGLFAVLGSGRSTKCRLVACMVLSIIAAVAAGVGLIFDGRWMSDAIYFWMPDSDGPANPAPLLGCAGGIVLSIINVAVSIVCASLMCANASCCCGAHKQAKTVVIAIPMESINTVLAKNNSEANSNVIVVPYKP